MMNLFKKENNKKIYFISPNTFRIQYSKICREDQAGFTLLETMGVIIIIGLIIVVIPYPNLILSSITLETEIDKIVNDLRWTRMMAIIKNETYYFRIYSKQNIYNENYNGQIDYIIYYIDDSDQPIVVKQGEYPAEFVLFKNRAPVRITNDYYERIKFYGYGTALPGTVGLRNNEGDLIQVVVSQLGRIRIEK